MNKGANIFPVRDKSYFRAFIGFTAGLLLVVKLATPFLHTHSPAQSEQVITQSLHCDACDYEAVQAIEPDAAIVLPFSDFQYEPTVRETEAPFLSLSHSPSESRGPPQVS